MFDYSHLTKEMMVSVPKVMRRYDSDDLQLRLIENYVVKMENSSHVQLKTHQMPERLWNDTHWVENRLGWFITDGYTVFTGFITIEFPTEDHNEGLVYEAYHKPIRSITLILWLDYKYPSNSRDRTLKSQLRVKCPGIPELGRLNFVEIEYWKVRSSALQTIRILERRRKFSTPQWGMNQGTETTRIVQLSVSAGENTSGWPGKYMSTIKLERIS
jgi:hypothetical protein